MKLFPLNPSHISQIIELESAAHVTPWTEKIISSSFGPRSRNVGLFKSHKGFDELVGYYFAEFVAGEMTLENICVGIQFQGKDHAKTLMQHLFEDAERLNAEEIWLEVRASNATAIQLYSNFGFEQISVRKNYYSIPDSNEKEDALLMKKALRQQGKVD